MKRLNRRTGARDSNIELLRIVAMVMIVAHHFMVHGDFSYEAGDMSVNRLWTYFLMMGGKIGVNLFVLISGYYMVKSPGGKTGKVVRIWLQLITYSLLLYAAAMGIGMISFHRNTLTAHLLPVTTFRWWFATTYCILCLLSPFLNRMIQSLDRRAFQKLLLLATVLWSVIPSVVNLTYFIGSDMDRNNLVWFVYLYFLGAYIRLYPTERARSVAWYFTGAAVSGILIFLSMLWLNNMAKGNPYYASHAGILSSFWSLPALLMSVYLFAGFLRVRIGSSRWINAIASATFGVYLIHDDGYMREFLWKTLFKNAQYTHSSLLIPYSIAVIVCVYVVCTAIELARIHLLEKRYLPAVDKVSRTIDGLIEKILDFQPLDRLL